MDTTEKDQVKEPAAPEYDATLAEIQSRESGDGDETKVNLGEEERLEKEPSDPDAREPKGGDKGEVMEGKKRHLLKDAKLFPMFFTMFGFRLVAAFVMLPLGVMLLVSGSWLNSGEFGMEAVASRPWPKLEVVEQEPQLKIIHDCALIGWILGFFMILNFFYNVWTFAALWTLIYAKLPWARESWNQARISADEFLSKVREESLVDQYHRMTKAQMESMARHDGESRIKEKETEAV